MKKETTKVVKNCQLFLGRDIEENKPCLVPNPAQNEVTVMGISVDIQEVSIIEMNGKHIQTFHNTTRFNVDNLASGHYIIRVITSNREVYYLKLIKQ
jgi:hypothetical protein